METLVQQRQRLLRELAQIQAALSSDDSKSPFAHLPPGKAIRKLLADEGKPCDRNTIVHRLIAGKANVGTRDPESNIKRAIDVNLQLGLLQDIKGKVGLPEWQFKGLQPDRSATDPRVKLVLEKMHTDLDQSFSIAQLAESVQLSPSRLSHLFLHEVGLPPLDYLRKVKMLIFRNMLRNSNLKQKEILEHLGIADRSHFSRHFKKLFHKSPAALRKQESRTPAACGA